MDPVRVAAFGPSGEITPGNLRFPGGEPRRIALLPGSVGAAEFWRPAAERLPADWIPSLWSWPGAGEQPHDPAVGGYEDLVERLATTLPAGGDVVAQSMGGAVALAVALARPEKVRRLVLVATSGGVDVGALGAVGWQREYREQFPGAAAWVTGPGPKLDSEQLGAIQSPVCLIWGDADPISPVAVGRLLDGLLPDSRLHVLAGGTHSLAAERPDQVAALITAFLR